MRVAVYTLGCKVNTYESEKIISDYRKTGAEIVAFDSPADLYIVNTCSVTQMADKKSRQVLHRARRNNPESVIVATGCYIQRKPADLPSEVDLVIYNEEKEHFLELVNSWLMEHCPLILEDKSAAKPAEGDVQSESESRIYEHTRAFLKIQDGCRQFCSYCIIPYARGALHSYPVRQVIDETTERVRRGFKEVVLTGIHLSSYGRKGTFPDPEEETTLGDLINELAQIEGLERIRLGSLEPGIITPEFVQKLASQKKLCPHFHLSMQSGCEKTLKTMNRHYTPDEYEQAVQLLRSVWPDVAVTTDVIVGFPGEEDEDFEASAAFVEKIGFAQIHVFKYSKREGTVAARRPNQVPNPVKNERSEKLIEMGKKLSEAYARSFLDKEVEVLLEEKTEDGWVGYTRNYLRVFVKTDPLTDNHRSGELVMVRTQSLAEENHEIGLTGTEG